MTASYIQCLARGLGVAVVVGLVGVNVVAAWQSYTMLHFDDSGVRTLAPEKLGWLGRARVLMTGVRMPRPQAIRTPAEYGMPFESGWIPGLGGVRLAFWHIPHTNALGVVMLFHGYGADRSTLLEEAWHLHDLGYTCVLIDFQGVGASSGQGTTLGFREAKDVALAVDWVRAQFTCKTLLLYGQSMGAAAVLRAVAQGGVKADGILVESVFDTLAQTVRNRFAAMKIPATPLAELLVAWGGWWAGYPAFTMRPVDDMAQVRCPVLMLHGAGDPRARIEEARRVYAAAPGPKHFVTFDDAGHESLAARNSRLWRDSVGAFCDSVARGSHEEP